MTQREVIGFFRRYRHAFDRLDGDAVTALWHAPAAIADSAGAQRDAAARITHWRGATAIRRNMRALCALYRRSGYAGASFELREHMSLGRHQSFAKLRWTIRRADGSVLQRFDTGYHLVRGEQGIRVLAAAAYDENLARMKSHAAE